MSLRHKLDTAAKASRALCAYALPTGGLSTTASQDELSPCFEPGTECGSRRTVSWAWRMPATPTI
jgi:hypothetical protein